ncbi:hypothetical protein DPMN_008534 [Dreissena polymorpha]|uniref:Uncharacterized protein n=2 Tax=Dreissena polymorpha TaxID=45954 RepID=A0A9D4RX20_DREPO|nr:hypothetical protein DPMN_008534 [Dreissena polymorpha]
MMAGIGIALFLVGAVLGIILTCIALRRSKQPLRRPFSRDPAEVDDYHDDDNQQL